MSRTAGSSPAASAASIVPRPAGPGVNGRGVGRQDVQCEMPRAAASTSRIGTGAFHPAPGACVLLASTVMRRPTLPASTTRVSPLHRWTWTRPAAREGREARPRRVAHHSEQKLAHAVEEQQTGAPLAPGSGAEKALGLAARRISRRAGCCASRRTHLSLETDDASGPRRHAGPGRRELDGAPRTVTGSQVTRSWAGRGPPVLLLHGLGGSGQLDGADGPAAASLVPRVVLLELPGMGGRGPGQGAGSARVRRRRHRLRRRDGPRARPARWRWPALARRRACALRRPRTARFCAGVVGLNPAGAELSDEAMNALPRAFTDPNTARRTWPDSCSHRTPWPFLAVARDFARHWGRPPVQRILTTRGPAAIVTGAEVLTDIHVPVPHPLGPEDRCSR